MSKRPQSKLRAEIVELLKRSPQGCRPVDVARETNRHPTNVKQELCEMFGLGLVVRRQHNGLWTLYYASIDQLRADTGAYERMDGESRKRMGRFICTGRVEKVRQKGVESKPRHVDIPAAIDNRSALERAWGMTQ